MNSRQLSVPVRRPGTPPGASAPPAARWCRWARVAAVLAGLAALAVYLRPGLAAPGAHWPLWDVRVYWWGGQQAARGGALYAPGARYSFTYPPFAAVLFTLAAPAPEGDLAAVITVASIGALAVLCALALGAAGVRRRPETVFAVTVLALLTYPVAYTLHLGEVNLILAALAGADLLRRYDGYWWQGIATGLAAGIKLTPLIFVAYLLVTRRVRAAATAAATFAATVAIGFVLLPSPSRVFWLDGVFYNQRRIGDPANPSDESLSGAVARLAGRLAGLLVVGHRSAARRPGRDHGRRVGAPARPPAGRGDLLRRHRPARLAVLLDSSLGVGRAAAGGAGRHRVAAALRRVRPGRGGSRLRILRTHPATGGRACVRSGPVARGRALRALRPGGAGGRGPRPPPGAGPDGPSARSCARSVRGAAQGRQQPVEVLAARTAGPQVSGDARVTFRG